MRLVRLDHVHAGGILARPVTTTHGSVLLSEGAVISDQMIGRLHQLGVPWLFFRRAGALPVADVEPHWVRPAVKQEMLDMYLAVRQAAEMRKPLPAERIIHAVTDLLFDLNPHRGKLLQPMDVRTIENDFFMHPFYVCVLSVMIGFRLELPYSELRALAVGAFLHDAGKFVPGRNDQQPAGDHHHTWMGYRLLKGEPLLPLTAAHAALLHHERVDGKGIPRGVCGDEMHLFGKIVAIASRYDQFFRALRPFSDNDPPLQHHDVYERMIGMVGKELDHDVFQVFMHTVAVYPDGAEVLLNRGQHAVVDAQRPELPSRPVVRIMEEGAVSTAEAERIDLSKDPRRFILEVYS